MFCTRQLSKICYQVLVRSVMFIFLNSIDFLDQVISYNSAGQPAALEESICGLRSHEYFQ